MSIESYCRIETDRRADAEILSEIARCPAEKLVFSAVDLAQSLSDLVPWPTSSSVLLVEPSRPELMHGVTQNWPTRLSLLVTPPDSYGVVAVIKPQPQRDGTPPAATFWEWVLTQAETEAEVVRQKPPTGFDLQSSRQKARRKLVLGKSGQLSATIHRLISRLVDVPFPENSPDVTALQAGLFQWHDALDQSHECSQSIEGRGRRRAGDYWHAIMHRREPDYGNSKYWFRHVGSHPIFPELAQQAEPLIAASLPEWKDRLLRRGWDPFAFVDLCEAAAQTNQPAWEAAAETIQEIEMLLLLESTYQDATSSR